MKHLNMLFGLLLCILSKNIYAQMGLSVTPPRLYFEKNKGESGTQIVSVNNVSKDKIIDVAVSLGDWEYDSLGANILKSMGEVANTCAKWISVKSEHDFFTLQPGEKKDIEVSITQPDNHNDTFSVYTAMLYFTQMNPYDEINPDGSKVKVGVRSGVKIYFRNPVEAIKNIEIFDFKYDKTNKQLILAFENKCNIWNDGIINLELLNINTGKKTTFPHNIYYTLPNNKRYLTFELPSDFENGKYKASAYLDYGVENVVEVAELNFRYD
jgi:hypothetical protein